MSRRKTENFYRCEPEAALKGMIGLSLEERGVYRTLIDLMYLQWRPIAYDTLRERQYVVQWVGAAAQKVNPIIGRLVAMKRLHLIEIDGSKYLTDDKFERERDEFKGDGPVDKVAQTQIYVAEKSGDVDTKSDDVEAKSEEVAKKSRLCEGQTEENQSLSDTRKEEKREDNSPIEGELSSETVAGVRAPEPATALPNEGQAVPVSASGVGKKGRRAKSEPQPYPKWQGDPAIRAAVANDRRYGDGFAVAYIDPASQRADGVVVARTHEAFKHLRKCEALPEGVRVVAPP